MMSELRKMTSPSGSEFWVEESLRNSENRQRHPKHLKINVREFQSPSWECFIFTLALERHGTTQMGVRKAGGTILGPGEAPELLGVSVKEPRCLRGEMCLFHDAEFSCQGTMAEATNVYFRCQVQMRRAASQQRQARATETRSKQSHHD